MTNLEISKALALAIGWDEYLITTYTTGNLYVHYVDFDGVLGCGKRFDYRDWNVIGPIAEKYNCFPRKYTVGPKWFVLSSNGTCRDADTPQKAIALAVIGAMK
jgi:hypothetical protein